MALNREQREKRAARAVELRLAGKTFRDIATEIEVSRTRAFQIVQKELEASQKEYEAKAARLRTLEMNRLDYIQDKLWAQLEKSDLSVVPELLRLMERRAKLAGLDAPERVDWGGGLPGGTNVLSITIGSGRIETLKELGPGSVQSQVPNSAGLPQLTEEVSNAENT